MEVVGRKLKLMNLETDSKDENMRDSYRGMSDLKKVTGLELI